MSGNIQVDIPHPTASFATTHWSVVLAAADDSSTQADPALERLCRDYWKPVYACVRRQGHDGHAAQDLTQSFFQRLLDKRFLRSVDPGRDKFRSFLQACLRNFLAKEWRDGHTLKRGGATAFVPLDLDAADERIVADIPSSLPPELVFDREWALAVLNQALSRMENEAAQSGKGDSFAALKQFLTAPTPAGGYEAIAPGLDMTPQAVSMAVLRLRQRFRDVVREAVSQTVTTPLELVEELRHLRNILSQ